MTTITTDAVSDTSFSLSNIIGKALVYGMTLLLLYVAWVVYMVGQPMFGVIVMLVALGFFFVFGFRRFYFARFIYPGIATMALFVIFPIFYTIYLGFTNYGSFNLLTFERAKEVILSRTIVDKDNALPFVLGQDGDNYRVYLGDAGNGFLSASPKYTR